MAPESVTFWQALRFIRSRLCKQSQNEGAMFNYHRTGKKRQDNHQQSDCNLSSVQTLGRIISTLVSRTEGPSLMVSQVCPVISLPTLIKETNLSCSIFRKKESKTSYNRRYLRYVTSHLLQVFFSARTLEAIAVKCLSSTSCANSRLTSSTFRKRFCISQVRHSKI